MQVTRHPQGFLFKSKPNKYSLPMPETSQATIVFEIGAHQEKVRSLLNHSDLIPIEDIQEALSITRPQALTILQQMEAAREIRVGRSSGRLFVSLK